MEDKLNELMAEIVKFTGEHTEWVVMLCAVFVATWLANFVLQKLLRKMGASSVSGLQYWRKALVVAGGLPLRVFIWIGGIAIALGIVQEKLKLPALDTILAFQPPIHTLIIGWFVLRLIRQSSLVAAHKYPQLSIAQLDTIQKVFTAVVAVAIAMLILPNFGISISGLLAFGGVGGVVAGLAAKDMLANAFGAMMLYFDRPFAVGDWVELPEKNIQGKVEHIGWRQVIVRTFDKRPVFIPSAMFGTLILVNPGKMTHRRIYETIGVRYQDMAKVPAILADIRAALDKYPALDKAAGIVVHLDKFNAYSVDILVSAFTRQTEWADYLVVKEKALFEISAIIAAHGADIAFPTQVMQVQHAAAMPSDPFPVPPR
ncbi:MAG: mechanosensitive ion channel [Alphaproteobacteria bacterium]|nr:mechanosensitive ion channel [Alphaproteobacteria bacterium]